MSFLIKNIDHAIEWALRDEFVRRGLWPDQRAFMLANDEPGFQAALAALNPKVDIFGVGNFKDRSELKENNVIINREGPSKGVTGFAHPFRFELQPNKTFNKIQGAEGSVDFEYEIRFVADDVSLDRIITEAMLYVFRNRKYLFGMNDDLSNMTEGFWIEKLGQAVDLGGKDYIERVFQFAVRDVIIDQDIVVENIPMTTQIDVILNVPPIGSDVMNPETQYDVATITNGVGEYFLDRVQDLPAWKKFTVARLYANNSEANAIKNLRQRAHDAVNSGLTFTPFKGFNKTGVDQYLDTLVRPADLFLTNYSYVIFVTDAPAAGLLEFFGLVDTVQNTSFFFRSDQSALGIQAKGNSDVQLQLTWKVKANTMYTFTRKDRFQLEIWEGENMIGVLQSEPTLIPVGKVFDLNIANQSGVTVGSSNSGGLGFSAAGEGLRASEIKDLNSMVRFYFTKIGVIPLS